MRMTHIGRFMSTLSLMLLVLLVMWSSSLLDTMSTTTITVVTARKVLGNDKSAAKSETTAPRARRSQSDDAADNPEKHGPKSGISGQDTPLVTVVDYDSFRKFIKKQPVLLEFYAPW
jgi:hypothetical protein